MLAHLSASVVTLLVVAAGPLSAQQPQPPAAAIAPEFVAVLGRLPLAGGPGSGDLRPGPAPAGFPMAVLPRGAEVGVVLEAPAMNAVFVIARVPTFAPEDLARHEQTLIAAGWTSRLTPPTGGFTIAAPLTSVSVCRGNEAVGLQAVARQEGGSFVRASVSRGGARGGPCTPMPTRSIDLALPTLTPPPTGPTPTASMPSGMSGDGTNAMSSQTRLLDVAVELSQIVSHYERQLVAAGWRVTSRFSEGDWAAGARFAFKSVSGQDAVATLLASSLTPTKDVDVSLRAVRTARDSRMTPMPLR